MFLRKTVFKLEVHHPISPDPSLLMRYNEIVRWDSLHVGNDRLCVSNAAQRFPLPRPALLQARGVSTFGHRSSSQGHELRLSPLGICVPSAWHREDAQLMYRDQCCT